MKTKTKIKIAIYSGVIPSTTFIERLILGLSNAGCKIYLFGFYKKRVSYNVFIKVAGCRKTKFYKALHLVKYSVMLQLFQSQQKRKLDAILKSKSQDSLLDKVKCYPVLWHKPDVFHIQWAKNLEYWSWLKEFNVKLVLSLRGAHINYSPIADRTLADMYRDYFPRVDAFHAVSKAIAKEAEQYGAPTEKIKVVYSGLDSKTFDFCTKSNGSNFNMVSIGRPHWIKGYNYALDACNILKKQNIPFTYTIVGAEGYLELMFQIRDLGLEDHVVLLNSQSIDIVKKILNNANLLVMPSVQEGIANVVLEAMASGTLVLTTNCGGMTEVVQNDFNGYVCPVRDAKAIAECILKILELTDEQKILMLNRAKQTVEKQHTEAQMIDGMLAIYQNIL